MRATIYNVNSERIVYTANGPKTLQALKAKVKRRLKRIGVEFDTEIRRDLSENKESNDDILSKLREVRDMVSEEE